MAYTKASLNINDGFEDEELEVFYCTFEFNRKVDIKSGHQQGNLHAGLIHIVIEADKKKTMLDLMLKGEFFSGKVTFKKDTATGSGAIRTLAFEHARCVEYRETFDTSLKYGMRVNFSFWCEAIDVGGSSYEVHWKSEK